MRACRSRYDGIDRRPPDCDSRPILIRTVSRGGNSLSTPPPPQGKYSMSVETGGGGGGGRDGIVDVSSLGQARRLYC